ncbi:hypothetical protein SEA_WOLLYPOG_40 [Arthrobacter phage Wollypog]|uniref:Uncharacterized protein n=1 Tax=Arthrobacter phage Wollypog TaxID=2790985 RepID=A0A7T3KC84_9CAUD|nr:hypothetical protein PP291_gp40 [Arthrobacter phage Wollypog]QPX62592.1 hypothetical protein SEA_WOLLYPOG_40 [Arthrobacter phage Wollypog]
MPNAFEIDLFNTGLKISFDPGAVAPIVLRVIAMNCAMIADAIDPPKGTRK